MIRTKPTASDESMPGSGSAAHPDARAAYAVMGAQFEAVARSSRPLMRETCYAIAGHRVRCRVIGRGLAESMHDPWAHLAVEDSTSSPGGLLIDLWDEGETGVPHDTRADVVGPSPRFPFRISTDTRFVGHRLSQTLTWFDRRAGHIAGCVGDSSRLSVYERGRPLETQLLFWLRDQGVQLVHSALVSRQDDGVLFVGRSGSGKSTCSLACLQAGFDFLGDDKIALLPDGRGTYVGWSLTSSAHLELHHLARFPELKRHAIHDATCEKSKSVVLLSGVRPTQLRSRATIRALAIARILNDRPSGVQRASRGEALLATALSTVLQLPIETTRSMSTLADLVARVPCYSLNVGPDLHQLPLQVATILDDALRS